MQQSQSHYCYILHNAQHPGTYNGYTTHLERRLRQHNGELKGGARSTQRSRGAWSYLAMVTSNDPRFDKCKALSLEWHIRYPTGQRPRPPAFQGARGRLEGLAKALAHDKFRDIPFQLTLCAETLAALGTDGPAFSDNVTLVK